MTPTQNLMHLRAELKARIAFLEANPTKAVDPYLSEFIQYTHESRIADLKEQLALVEDLLLQHRMSVREKVFWAVALTGLLVALGVALWT